MPIIGVPASECGVAEYERLLPGTRVEYRGTTWKVVGMYFGPRSRGPAASQATKAQSRIKYLILKSLPLTSARPQETDAGIAAEPKDLA